MKKEYVKELERLTPRQREIVLSGLVNKLSFYKKSGILSYRYDVCPVCSDVSSDCDKCYIPKSCKAPFNDGFRDDLEAGASYFAEMRNVLSSLDPPSVFVAGGTWDDLNGSSSKIVDMIASELQANVINGGNISDCMYDSMEPCRDNDLIIWMPNIPNEETKLYPKKSKGSVLICSKVMREGYTKADAVSRIFRMSANAVISIVRKDNKFSFQLLDALGNHWIDTDNISKLSASILDLYRWTKASVRVGTTRCDKPSEELNRFINCTRSIADKVEQSIGERYFGNIMTRCQKMFPGMRITNGALVSPRNSDKRRLEAEDMVFVSIDASGNNIQYFGTKKPSVDTPIQLAVLRANSNINFFIHGHAYVDGAPETEYYYPCGDMREVSETDRLICGATNGIINLKNHGFLFYSSTIDDMENLIESVEFIDPN